MIMNDEKQPLKFKKFERKLKVQYKLIAEWTFTQWKTWKQHTWYKGLAPEVIICQGINKIQSLLDFTDETAVYRTNLAKYYQYAEFKTFFSLH